MTFPKANPPKPKYPGKESFVRCPETKRKREWTGGIAEKPKEMMAAGRGKEKVSPNPR